MYKIYIFIELRNIVKRFPGVVALKSMSLGIRPGEIHGLIGENGAGKSTFIKRFMETLVIPRIENTYMRERARDELPQSGIN